MIKLKPKRPEPPSTRIVKDSGDTNVNIYKIYFIIFCLVWFGILSGLLFWMFVNFIGFLQNWQI
jgi:hypothetical protein